MFIIAVANRKGGSGKTTTSVNLAAQFASSGLSTLLIDLDTQGHASQGLGLAGQVFANNIHHIFENPSLNILNMVIETVHPRLSFIPADINFIEGSQTIDANILHQQLQQKACASQYDVVVIDTPPTLGTVLLNAVVCANGFIIPFIPHHLSYVVIQQFIQLIEQHHHNSSSDYLLLPMMIEKRTLHHLHTLRLLQQDYGHDCLLRGVRTNIKLAEAFEAGYPIQYCFPKSPGAYDYHMLSEEIKGRWQMGTGEMPSQPVANKKCELIVKPPMTTRKRGIRLKQYQPGSCVI